jgi:hypothetical protein
MPAKWAWVNPKAQAAVISARPKSPPIQPEPGSSVSNAPKTRGQLTHHPVDPWFMLLFCRAQHPPILALHRFFHDGQSEAHRPQRGQALSQVRRHQSGDARIDASQVIEDDVRIHQRCTVIGDEGRRFQKWIELRELIDVPEERDWSVYKGSFCDGHRNGDPAHVRRINHTDQLHEDLLDGEPPYYGKQAGERQGKRRCARNNAVGEANLRSQTMRGNKSRSPSTQYGRQKRAKQQF